MLKVLEGLQRAIRALNMKPNFRLTEGIKSYELLSELDKVMRRESATRYEARIVEPDGSWFACPNAEDAITGDDYNDVLTRAKDALSEAEATNLNLVIAEVTTTYIKP